MQFSRQMYLVSPEDYRSLKAKGIVSEDMDMSKHNAAMIQNKILQKNQKDQEWQDYGVEMGKVISKGIDNSDSLTPPTPQTPSSPLPSSTPSNSTHELSFIREGVTSKMVNKVSQMYNLLKTLPGVVISGNNVTVDGLPQQGSTLDILKALVYQHKYLRYEINPLLQRMSTIPQIVALIGNGEAKQIIQQMRRITPSSPNTPDPDFTLDESDVTSFQSPVTTSTPKPLKKRKKKGGRIEKRKTRKWASIF